MSTWYNVAQPSYLVVLYEGHNQEDAEKQGKLLQSEMRQYGLRCHIHEIDKEIPEETDFVFCTHFTPGPFPDMHYFELVFKKDKDHSQRLQEIRKHRPGYLVVDQSHLHANRSHLHERMLMLWAQK